MAFTEPVFRLLRVVLNEVLQDAGTAVRVLTGASAAADNPAENATDVDFTAVEDQLDAIAVDYAAAEAAAGAGGDTTDLEDRVAQAEVDLQALVSDISDNTDDIATTTALIESTTTFIGIYAGEISDNADAIATFTAAISDNADDIATNAAADAAHPALIAANASDISDNADAISALQADPPMPTSVVKWAYLSGVIYSAGQNSYAGDTTWASNSFPNLTSTISDTTLPRAFIGVSEGSERSLVQAIEIPEGVDQVTITAYCYASSATDAAFGGRDLAGNLGTAITGISVSGGSLSEPAAITVATDKAIADLAWVAGELCYWYFEIPASTSNNVYVTGIKFEFSAS